MIPLTILLLSAVGLAWYISQPYYRGDNRHWDSFIFVFIVYGTAVVALFFTFVDLSMKPCPILPTGEYTIQAMQDTNKLEGDFFLGSGYINDRPVYSCYIQDEDNVNSYRRYIFSADPQYSRVEKGNIEQPYIDVVTESVGSFEWTFITGEKLVEYVFYVPPNSIVDNITLDAK